MNDNNDIQQMLYASVLPHYTLDGTVLKIETFGSGLINHTWKIATTNSAYIFQKVNENVFQNPFDIAFNVGMIGRYLKEHVPTYRFVAPLPAHDGREMIWVEGEGYFRVFHFVPGSYSKNVVETPEQAFEAASQFGHFTFLLSDFDASNLKITIPHFHDLALRYVQFKAALESGNPERISASKDLIKMLADHSFIVDKYNGIKSNPEFKLRVTHHDTKISNVLFDKAGKGLCVIDLDTVMPGYFLSDLGDMLRTYLSPVSEEEGDLTKIIIREEVYSAIVKGYYKEMKSTLTESETKAFFYAGLYMIYMQALRFLTDHLNNDVYYGADYPGHNFVRAKNQATLLQRLLQKEKTLTHGALSNIGG